MTPRNLSLAVLLAAALSFTLPTRLPAQPAETVVDVELVIAVDISMSMDAKEQRLQREGYVAAFRDPRVINAIASGLHQRIAVAFVEWAGTATQNLVLDWTLVDGPDAAAELAARLEALPFTRARRTSISGAIGFSAGLFENSGFRGLKRVIDVSGDGPNNQGERVTAARDRAVAQGIVINGLPFLTAPASYFAYFDIADLDLYYADCVIGGPGAFIVPVRDPSEFATAIRQKLVLEIAGPLPAREAANEPRVPCDIGERIWRMRMDGP
ncbi:DUF1194 domain-containing protein [Lutibaculum baratangense]|uniref:VWFA-like protein with metal ion dependent adhesion motif (MIDAS) n=1 Tax=Lutibaculum baratangense AMV1 TaxID=631454 RepID=V4R240_9HYPH|nr:DUF1194 domain-containing protein [Lutibaculum baratangense]ESR26012.1 vWFA-like protein with metal ion dependent adhesion motif (MIDAS) [Lutibaculum baratangense AMV1]